MSEQQDTSTISSLDIFQTIMVIIIAPMLVIGAFFLPEYGMLGQITFFSLGMFLFLYFVNYFIIGKHFDCYLQEKVNNDPTIKDIAPAF